MTKEKMKQKEAYARIMGNWCLSCKSDECKDKYHKEHFHTSNPNPND